MQYALLTLSTCTLRLAPATHDMASPLTRSNQSVHGRAEDDVTSTAISLATLKEGHVSFEIEKITISLSWPCCFATIYEKVVLPSEIIAGRTSAA